jgi:O-antigen ligase
MRPEEAGLVRLMKPQMPHIALERIATIAGGWSRAFRTTHEHAARGLGVAAAAVRGRVSDVSSRDGGGGTLTKAAGPVAQEEALAAPGETKAPRGARLALTVLVAMVVLSPWPMGSVDPPAARVITLVSLVTALAAFLLDARRDAPVTLPIPLWPLGALWLLGVAQLVPLPEPVHRLVAPGSAAVWHPESPAAAAVLGPGPRPISVHPEATRRTLAFGTGLLALALAAAPALRDRRVLLRATVAVVAGAVAVAVYALVARLVFGNKLYGIWSVPTVAPFGPFVNKNHFAGYVELAALLALGLASGLASEARRGRDWLSWIESPRARDVVLASGAAVVLILAVPVSLSRGGVASLTAGLATFVLLGLWERRERSPRAFLSIALNAGVLLLALYAVLPTEARSRLWSLAGITTEQSGSFRLGVWRDTLRLVASSPWVGSGFGAFEDALLRFKTGAGHLAIQHAESDCLELVAEGGVAAGLLALAGLILVFRHGFRRLTSASTPQVRRLARGVMASLVAVGAHSLYDFNLRIPSNALACALLVAAALASPDGTARRLGTVAPVVLATTLGLEILNQSRPTQVEMGRLVRAARDAGTSLRRSSLEAEVIEYLNHRPAHPGAWLALAWLCIPTARGDASDLGAWAASLDPTSVGVRQTLVKSGILIGPPK